MDNIVFYNYGGSANHGCEALVRTLSELLKKHPKILLSEAIEEDEKYGIDKIVSLSKAKSSYCKASPLFIKALYELKVNNNYFFMDTLPYIKPIKQLPKDCIGVSIGGDVYCYDDYIKYIMIHNEICKVTKKTMLIGCSIEPSLLKKSEMIEDLEKFDLITARESITYHSLIGVGIKNVQLIPDSAFTLPTVISANLDKEFMKNTIGINVSPLVEQKETIKNSVFNNYLYLIKYVLEETDCNIALVPHVVWKGNDDRTILKRLQNEFKNNDRIRLIDDCSCMELKGYISKCRFFIGARTHATIAAYSSCIPTLAVGYSVKARGIAQDLFNDQNNFVIPIENFNETSNLAKSFEWILENERSIKNHLNSIIPSYIEKAKAIADYI